MRKKHRKPKIMRRFSRVFLNDLNAGKAALVRDFLRLCHDATQYFVDLFWQRQDFSAELADLETVHRGCNRFGLTTRLGQALAKQAKETVRSQTEKDKKRKPQVRQWTVTLYMGKALKRLDWTNIQTLCIEDLKHVKSGKRGTFSRGQNRRLSHWLYAYTAGLLARHCEERGVRLELKDPAYTSQYCHVCGRRDRRNRSGDRFTGVHCGYLAQADENAAHNLELLGLAGAYGLRWLKSSECQSSE